MKNLDSLVVVAIAVVVMSVTPCFVQASTISSTLSFSGTGTQDMAFSQFNPILGTLTSVSLEVIGSLNSTLTAVNISNQYPTPGLGSPSGGTASTSSTFSVATDSWGFTPVVSPVTLVAGGQFTMPAGDSATVTGSQTFDFMYTTPNLTDFTGTGQVSLPASISMVPQIVAYGGGLTYAYATPPPVAGLTETLTYNYNPVLVPEPSTFALLAVGVLGLIGYVWRKRSV